MRNYELRIWGTILGLLFLWGCNVPRPTPNEFTEGQQALFSSTFQTKRLVMVTIDGPRFSETWGMYGTPLIPNMSGELAAQGVVFEQFYNNGLTKTVAGHVAIMTGKYEPIDNGGNEFPFSPSWMQMWLSFTQAAPEKACIIASKKKLAILTDCIDPNWRNRYNPSIDADDREDHNTLARAIEILDQKNPDVVLVHFRGPDVYGHSGDWEKYLEAIQKTDQYVSELWEFLQGHPYYQNQTALWITNDHGRHLDGISDGFSGHGDDCDGCRRISLLALGPGLQHGKVIKQPYQQTDLLPTAAKIFGFGSLVPGQHLIPDLVK